VRRDGTEFAIDGSAAPIHNRQGQPTGAVTVFHDVSVARAIGAEMSHLAQHDTLTNLPNRTLLQDRLNQAIALASRNRNQMAVLFLDLDGFKQINDSMGHFIGDKRLRSVAKRLVSSVRHSDTVSRLGGDEFVILLVQIKNAGDGGFKAGKLLKVLSEPFEIDSHNFLASIGVATYVDESDAESLLKSADLAMYQAKQKGHNSYRQEASAQDLKASGIALRS
jgi:diguanylate cyclase (GGDEF)-like protein